MVKETDFVMPPYSEREKILRTYIDELELKLQGHDFENSELARQLREAQARIQQLETSRARYLRALEESIPKLQEVMEITRSLRR